MLAYLTFACLTFVSSSMSSLMWYLVPKELGYSTKFCTGMLHSQVQTVALLLYITLGQLREIPTRLYPVQSFRKVKKTNIKIAKKEMSSLVPRPPTAKRAGGSGKVRYTGLPIIPCSPCCIAAGLVLMNFRRLLFKSRKQQKFTLKPRQTEERHYSRSCGS